MPVKLGDYQRAVEACEILKPAICAAIDEVRVRQGEPTTDAWQPTRWSDFGRELTCFWEEPQGAGCPGDVETATGTFEPSGAPFENICAGCGERRDEHITRCRARFDLYYPPAALLADVKVVTKGYAGLESSEAFGRALDREDNSLLMQGASYLRGLETVHPEIAGRSTFVFLRCEVKPPYAVVPVVLTPAHRKMGEDRWDRGVRGWAGCMAAGSWPGTSPVYPQPQTWAIQRELDRDVEDQMDEGAEDERDA